MPDQITMAFEEWYSIDEYDDETLVLLGAFSVGWKAHEKAAQQGEQRTTGTCRDCGALLVYGKCLNCLFIRAFR